VVRQVDPKEQVERALGPESGVERYEFAGRGQSYREMAVCRGGERVTLHVPFVVKFSPAELLVD
jgi:hypothetical protein